MIQLNLKRLGAGGFETMRHTQTPEAPRIDKAQFPSRCQFRNQVGVFCDFSVGLANHHAPGHSQVDDPLGVDCVADVWGGQPFARRFCFLVGPSSRFSLWRARAPAPHDRRFQIKDDMFSYPAHACNAPGLERGNNLRRRRFQRLRLRSQPDRLDDVPGDPAGQAPSDGFNFRKFGHRNQSTVVSLQSSAMSLQSWLKPILTTDD